MIIDKGLTRSIRLTQIQHLLHSSPAGLTTREIAELCGVCVRTVQRDLLSLQADLGIPITQNGDRYGIIDTYVLPPVSFTLNEAMVLALAARLVLRQSDAGNPHVESALGKLAGMLPAGPGAHLRRSAEAIRKKKLDPRQVRIFEQVAIAWCTHRPMRIKYLSLASEEAREWYLEPYFVDMTSTGFSTYVIGQAESNERSGLTTFKLERVKEAEILDGSFVIPEGTDLEELLGPSWGVMMGEETEVKLKFAPKVARRVKESEWHASQEIEDLPDGGCLLTLRVASTLEMTPWLRGWGPDVEVLEPESLRSEFAEYARRLHDMYGEE
ncbi:MAG: WYL domain-containing transcriptional regulator [Dehalococcoidia bacterium]